MIYDLIPHMKEEWLTKIMNAFAENILRQRALSELFSAV